MEVGLGPGDIALDGDPTSPKGTQQPPVFGRCLMWPNSCMLHGLRCSFVRPYCVWWKSSSPRKGHSIPHISAHVYCGQTVAHLSNYWPLVFLEIQHIQKTFLMCDFLRIVSVSTNSTLRGRRFICSKRRPHVKATFKVTYNMVNGTTVLSFYQKFSFVVIPPFSYDNIVRKTTKLCWGNATVKGGTFIKQTILYDLDDRLNRGRFNAAHCVKGVFHCAENRDWNRFCLQCTDIRSAH